MPTLPVTGLAAAVAWRPVDSGLYQQIVAFYAMQAKLLDAGLHDEASLRAWAETFAWDGSFWINFAPAPAHGRDAIVAAIQRSTTHVREQNIVRRHWFNQIAVADDGDRIRTRYYCLVFATAPGGTPVVDASTVAEDVLERLDGRLIVRSRQVLRDDIP